MGNEYIYILVLLALISLIFAFAYNNSLNIKYVKRNSELFKALSTTKTKYVFHIINESYYLSYKYDKKSKYNKDSPEKFMKRQILNNRNFYETVVENANQNAFIYNNYLMEYQDLEKTIGTALINKEITLKDSTFIRIEKKIYRQSKLGKPIDNFTMKFKLMYTSPKGRNSYSKEQYYDKYEIENQVKTLLQEINEMNARQYAIKVERSNMTNHLRYVILKRDNFRCKLCGSTSEDGVKLHIDHIIPVSKGGKTESSNLRTLCDRCNIGKKDKIE